MFMSEHKVLIAQESSSFTFLRMLVSRIFQTVCLWCPADLRDEKPGQCRVFEFEEGDQTGVLQY